MANVRRQELITLLGGAAAALPLSARAQQPGTPVIGFLSSRLPDEFKHLVNAFRAGLHTGWLLVAKAKALRLSTVGPRVIITAHQCAGDRSGSPCSGGAGNGRGRTLGACGEVGDVTDSDRLRFRRQIPLEPVSICLASLSRPGGNATGVSLLTTETEAKRLGLLSELVPERGCYRRPHKSAGGWSSIAGGTGGGSRNRPAGANCKCRK